PVILIPGIVSTGLEVWNTGPKYFRKRIWGTTDHLKSMLLNNACWIYHMMLDEKTGMDPPGVKLRAAQGLDAADYLFPGFWVWAKLISNLGALGYDSNNMHLASYDWRLSLTKLEIRDRFFTKLKSTIEITYEHAGGGESARVVLVSHSMGATVVLYFMNWIKGELGHQNGDAWCAQYLQGWVNIAGTLLGVPKSVASMLSGEMKDTAQLNGIQAFALENYLMPKAQRARLFRSWGGIASMIPYGGDTIWGKKVTYAAQVHHTSPTDHNASAEINSSNTTRHDFSANATLPLILAVAGDPYWKDTHVWNVAQTKKELRQSKHDKRSWTNPLVAPLPSFGPHFKIYCLYGTGLPTERKYFYRTDGEIEVDTGYTDRDLGIISGVQMAEGDGTVPLMSLGYMCVEGWKHQRYNPNNVTVITREFKDQPAGMLSARGGPGSADHVDILGNYDLTEDILRIVGGWGHHLSDRVDSPVREMASRVHLPEGLD
ncbi:Lecithin:cholesterol/phospholipid:diacylglycerol acyltransferase, partial [Phlyctochytrium arcticum]